MKKAEKSRFRPYSTGFQNLIQSHLDKLPIPTFMMKIPIGNPNPFALWGDEKGLDRALVPFWWHAFRNELTEIKFAGGRALAFLKLSKLWCRKPCTREEEGRGNGYRYIHADAYFGLWALDCVFLLEHIYYFLDGDKRVSLSEGRSVEKIRKKLGLIGSGVRPSYAFQRTELRELRGLLQALERLSRRVADLREYRDRRAHRFHSFLGRNSFPFSVRPGRVTGSPVIEGPGDPSRLRLSQAVSLVPALWRDFTEIFSRIRRFTFFDIWK